MMRLLMMSMLMTMMLLLMASIVMTMNLTRVVALPLLLHAVQHEPPLRVPFDLLLSFLPNRVDS